MNAAPCLRAAVLAGIASLLAGCATMTPPPAAWRYLDRDTTRIAIMPATNRTDNAGTPIILDKDWEEALKKAGFQVVNADSVVSFASSRGIPMAQLSGLASAQLGGDLHADFLLENEITEWDTRYVVLAAGSTVAGRSRLVEAVTGATVWELRWRMDSNANSGNGGIAGLLAQAIATALVNSAMDVPARLASQGVALCVATMPLPGHPPPGAPAH